MILKKTLTKLDSELHVKRIPSWIHSKPLLPTAWFNVVNMTCWKAESVALLSWELITCHPNQVTIIWQAKQCTRGNSSNLPYMHCLIRMIFVSTSIVMFGSMEVKEHMKLQLKLGWLIMCVFPLALQFAITLPRESDQSSTWHLQNLSLRAKSSWESRSTRPY